MGSDFDPNVDRYLNRAAFSAPVGTLGNTPRVNGDVRRPWNMTENVSLAKTISMPGTTRLDVRIEAFNIFNRIIWNLTDTEQNFNSADFGRVSGTANSPRQMQLGLKLYW